MLRKLPTVNDDHKTEYLLLMDEKILVEMLVYMAPVDIPGKRYKYLFVVCRRDFWVC